MGLGTRRRAPTAVLVVQGPREREPVAGRVVRVEAHGLSHPPLAVHGSAEIRDEIAHLAHDPVVVGVEGERPILMGLGQLELLPHQIEGGEDAVDLTLAVVEGVRLLDLVEMHWRRL